MGVGVSLFRGDLGCCTRYYSKVWSQRAINSLHLGIGLGIGISTVDIQQDIWELMIAFEQHLAYERSRVLPTNKYRPRCSFSG